MASVILKEVTISLNQAEIEAVIFALRYITIEDFQSKGKGELYKAGVDVCHAIVKSHL